MQPGLSQTLDMQTLTQAESSLVLSMAFLSLILSIALFRLSFRVWSQRALCEWLEYVSVIISTLMGTNKGKTMQVLRQ